MQPQIQINEANRQFFTLTLSRASPSCGMITSTCCRDAKEFGEAGETKLCLLIEFKRQIMWRWNFLNFPLYFSRMPYSFIILASLQMTVTVMQRQAKQTSTFTQWHQSGPVLPLITISDNHACSYKSQTQYARIWMWSNILIRSLKTAITTVCSGKKVPIWGKAFREGARVASIQLLVLSPKSGLSIRYTLYSLWQHNLTSNSCFLLIQSTKFTLSTGRGRNPLNSLRLTMHAGTARMTWSDNRLNKNTRWQQQYNALVLNEETGRLT